MAEPFLSEIRIMSFNFPPKGWAFCNGQFLPINQNQPLFALLGTTYGGNGQTTFALPDLRGRVPIHQGSGHTLGERAGEEAHTVSISELPTHTHVMSATTALPAVGQGLTPGPTQILAKTRASFLYASPANVAAMPANALVNTGGSQAHQNMQPFLVLNFCIALQGIFPSQN
jgi:microcystin-dependent protein